MGRKLDSLQDILQHKIKNALLKQLKSMVRTNYKAKMLSQTRILDQMFVKWFAKHCKYKRALDLSKLQPAISHHKVVLLKVIFTRLRTAMRQRKFTKELSNQAQKYYKLRSSRSWFAKISHCAQVLAERAIIQKHAILHSDIISVKTCFSNWRDRLTFHFIDLERYETVHKI